MSTDIDTPAELRLEEMEVAHTDLEDVFVKVMNEV